MGNASLVWFRRDLRILDHEALRAACANGKFVTALYVDETESSARRRLGGASRWWLYHSLKALRTSLADLNIKLVLKRGDPTVLIANTATEIGARNVYCSAIDEPAEIELTQQVTQSLQRDGCTLKVFSSSLLRPPVQFAISKATAIKFSRLIGISGGLSALQHHCPSRCRSPCLKQIVFRKISTHGGCYPQILIGRRDFGKIGSLVRSVPAKC